MIALLVGVIFMIAIICTVFVYLFTGSVLLCGILKGQQPLEILLQRSQNVSHWSHGIVKGGPVPRTPS